MSREIWCIEVFTAGQWEPIRYDLQDEAHAERRIRHIQSDYTNPLRVARYRRVNESTAVQPSEHREPK
jgi:hypothetical protein